MEPEEALLEGAGGALGGMFSSQGGGGDAEEEEEVSSPLQFEVQVSRAGKIMTLACTSEDALACVEGITISSDADGVGEEGELYRGPILEDLPEDVREGLDGFLREDCGVDEDVAAFAVMYGECVHPLLSYN